jgi:predicted DNA-binding transcriptional regulator AlpA
METVVKLAIERMSEEIEKLKVQVREQQQRISQLEKTGNRNPVVEKTETLKIEDELLNNEQVKSILKIGKNSLIKLVREGILVAIRINERSVRFSKAAIMKYIEQKQAGSLS